MDRAWSLDRYWMDPGWALEMARLAHWQRIFAASLKKGTSMNLNTHLTGQSGAYCKFITPASADFTGQAKDSEPKWYVSSSKLPALACPGDPPDRSFGRVIMPISVSGAHGFRTVDVRA